MPYVYFYFIHFGGLNSLRSSQPVQLGQDNSEVFTWNPSAWQRAEQG